MAEVESLLGEYKADQSALMDSIIQIMWHMRGSVSREEAWTLSFEERKAMFKLIEERIKLTEKSRMPLL